MRIKLSTSNSRKNSFPLVYNFVARLYTNTFFFVSGCPFLLDFFWKYLLSVICRAFGLSSLLDSSTMVRVETPKELRDDQANQDHSSNDNVAHPVFAAEWRK
jgi:hypothetical protein